MKSLGVLKFSNKDSQNILLLELAKKEKLDGSVYQQLLSSGFLYSVPIQYNEKKQMVRYDLSGLISLKVRLGSAITIDEFYLLLANLYHSFLELVNNLGVHPSLLDWSPDLIFLDVKGNVYFTVYPLVTKTVEGSGYFHLVKTLITKAKPFQSVDNQGLERLRGFLQAVETGASDSESFIYNLGLESLKYKSENLGDYQSPQLKLILEGIESIEEELKPEVITEVVGGVELDLTHLDTEMMERTGLLDTSSDDDLEHTTMLEGDESQVAHSIGYLLRSNGDSFELDSRSGVDTWVFGKRPKFISSAELGFPLSDNKFISGTHFRVIYEEDEDRFYVEDLGSTNGTWLKDSTSQTSTWLDSERLSLGKPMIIKNGDTIRIAKEEVQFKVKEV